MNYKWSPFTRAAVSSNLYPLHILQRRNDYSHSRAARKQLPRSRSPSVVELNLIFYWHPRCLVRMGSTLRRSLVLQSIGLLDASRVNECSLLYTNTHTQQLRRYLWSQFPSNVADDDHGNYSSFNVICMVCVLACVCQAGLEKTLAPGGERVRSWSANYLVSREAHRTHVDVCPHTILVVNNTHNTTYNRPPTPRHSHAKRMPANVHTEARRSVWGLLLSVGASREHARLAFTHTHDIYQPPNRHTYTNTHTFKPEAGAIFAVFVATEMAS